MKLQPKLFLSIGAVFVVLAVILYFLPGVLLRGTLERAEADLKAKYEQNLEEGYEGRQSRLSEKVAEIEGMLDAALYVLSEHAYRNADREFSEQMNDLWAALTGMFFYNGDVHLAEVAAGRGWDYSIIVDRPPAFLATSQALDASYSWFALRDNSREIKPGEISVRYLGLRMTLPLSEAEGQGPSPAPTLNMPQIFMLCDWDLMLQAAPGLPGLLKARDGLQQLEEALPSYLQNRASVAANWQKALQQVEVNIARARAAAIQDDVTALGKALQDIDEHQRIFFDEDPSLIAFVCHLWGAQGSGSPYGLLVDARKSIYRVPLLIDDSVIDAVKTTWDLRRANLGVGHKLTAAMLAGMQDMLPNSTLLDRMRYVQGVAAEVEGMPAVALKRQSVFVLGTYFDHSGKQTQHHIQNFVNPTPGYYSSARTAQQPGTYLLNTTAFSEAGVSVDDDKRPLGYLTLGSSMDQLTSLMAVLTSKMSLLVQESQARLSYDTRGAPMAPTLAAQLPIDIMLQHRSGVFTLGRENYFYVRYELVPESNLRVFTITPQATELAFVAQIDEQVGNAAGRVQKQLTLVAMLSLAVALVILSIIGRRITKPVVQLAHNTALIVQGAYDKVALPPKGSGKDEISGLIEAFREMLMGLRDREKIRGVLDKVVSKEIAREILSSEIALGGEDREISVLFADIRNFTSMSEAMSPQEVIAMLNDCMTRISKTIETHGGVIDKYIGDEVMAIYGAPVYKEDHALRAVWTAWDIVKQLRIWNQERWVQGLQPLTMGVGVHSGRAVAGNMGAENRLNYTVVGATVNLAARLCARSEGLEVLISQETLKAPGVADAVEVEPLPPISIKGISQPVQVFRLRGLRQQAPESNV